MLIMSHPTPWEFHPVHHPSYIDFFEQVLAETTDPVEIEARFEKQFAEDEWYRHLYRTSYAYHGVHPFYMWYWGCHGMAAPRQGDHRRRRARGGAPARLHAGVDAAGRPRDGQRRRRPRPHHHPPPQPADPHGGRDVSDGEAPADLPRARGPAFPFTAPTVPDTVERARRRRRASAPTTRPTGPAASRPAWRAVVLLEAVDATGGGRARRARARAASTGSPASPTAR